MTQGVSPSMWTAAAAVAVAIAGAADSRRAAISGGIAGIASTQPMSRVNQCPYIQNYSAQLRHGKEEKGEFHLSQSCLRGLPRVPLRDVGLRPLPSVCAARAAIARPAVARPAIARRF